jgi:uncharacterized delta-60 repeat protein
MRHRITTLRFGTNLGIGLLIAAAVWLGAVSRAEAKPGQLDPTFGDRGRAVAALNFGDPHHYQVGVEAALAPDGKIVVSGDERLVRFLPNGRRDRSFAAGGVLNLDLIEGREFTLVDLAIDGESRMVAVGSLAPTSGGTPEAALLRFSPKGALDPSFGGGDGVVATQFGLPRPEVFPSKNAVPPQVQPHPAPTGPMVGISSVAVDSQDRIVLSGKWTVSESFCPYPSLWDETAGSVIARFMPDGALDPAFGSGGVLTLSEAAEGAPSLSLNDLDIQEGRLLLLLGVQTPCERDGDRWSLLHRLDAGGSMDESFGANANGWRRTTSDRMQVAIDRSGRILVLGSPVLRLLPSGRRDPSFGAKGKAVGTFPPALFWTDLAVTRRGGVVLGGTWHQPRYAPPQRAAIALIGPRGSVDEDVGGGTGFGKAGLGPRTATTGRAVLLDGKGHAIIAGSVSDPELSTGEGLALFRFDLKR